MNNYMVTVKVNGKASALEVSAKSIKDLKEKYAEKFVGATLIGKETNDDLIRNYVIANFSQIPDVEKMVIDVKNKIEDVRKTYKVGNVIFSDIDGIHERELVIKPDNVEKWCTDNGVTYMTIYKVRRLNLPELIRLASALVETDYETSETCQQNTNL